MAVKRRQGCPQTILHLWDAIAYIRQQKQIPNFERLSGYMKRVYNLNSPDLETQLKYAVLDDLIHVKTRLGCKGSKIGVEQDGYRIPEKELEKDGHDWYCFECHSGGEVISCTTCYRVYHPSCLSSDVKSVKFICSVCQFNAEKFSVPLKRSEINTLLGFTCVRLKEKTKELHRIPHPDDEKWRFNFLIYEQMDLVAMEDKMKNNEYMRLGDFYTDAQQIVHNVIVYFGTQSRIADMARQMLSDCEYDLQEIVQCSSCYKMSNMKSDTFWFCQPCSPPHELVFAKVKGFDYWPAKVIRKDEHNNYDVRFFGAFHQRALVDEIHVKPVTSSLKQLGIKKTAAFDRAYKELQHHQRLVKEAAKTESASKEQNNKHGEETSTDSDKTQDSSFPSPKPKGKPGRKRKNTSPQVPKPPSAKKPATVPVKKNKKFYQESPTSSSPKNSSENVSIQEDHNFVSSSSQEAQISYSTVGVQTDKELLVVDSSENKDENVETKENTKNGTEKTCDCSTKYEKLLKDLRTTLEEEHRQDKSKALKELSDELHSELEAEKQRNLVAIEKVQQKRKEALRKAEEQRKAAYELEISKLLEQQKTELSEIKRKQWCYNCELEAIYHCCWNTSYCSVECQQVHWHKEHKRTCRRKR